MAGAHQAHTVDMHATAAEPSPAHASVIAALLRCQSMQHAGAQLVADTAAAATASGSQNSARTAAALAAAAAHARQPCHNVPSPPSRARDPSRFASIRLRKKREMQQMEQELIDKGQLVRLLQEQQAMLRARERVSHGCCMLGFSFWYAYQAAWLQPCPHVLSADLTGAAAAERSQSHQGNGTVTMAGQSALGFDHQCRV